MTDPAIPDRIDSTQRTLHALAISCHAPHARARLVDTARYQLFTQPVAPGGSTCRPVRIVSLSRWYVGLAGSVVCTTTLTQ